MQSACLKGARKRHRARGYESVRFGGSRGGQRQAKKGRLAPRATQSLRSTLTLQYVGTPVINLLADVPGSMRDLEPPAKMYSKAVSELRAVLEVP